ncbi:NAD(P)/FAD-dependent oxidoreductase [Oceanobacter mangrovi]|uniref:NAD(P)/FAD-dependent oxidoreductase n=1 Tax=Oceanobacter mangrovi TaxID=2862510 RepID=UPI001C8EE668|nr:NAD(P)/FAD-dependent oxidoreductase [Oceanobacter mangrovi]
MNKDFDVCIIGAGVIGLAIAARLSRRYSIVVVEQHARPGTETSARNSEVIHAGLYYPPGTLKESLCLRGKQLLYDYCQQRHIDHRPIGKLIVSPVKDHPRLQHLETTAARLAVPLQRLSQREISTMQPGIKAAEALLSPTTGIINSEQLMLALQGEAESNQAIISLHTRFERAVRANDLWQLELHTTDGPFRIHSQYLINAAGLSATDIYNYCQPDDTTRVDLYPARGHYFSYQGGHPFRQLVYPLPEPGLAGLGIHATLDLGGRLRFGPDVEYLTNQQLQQADRYQVSPARKQAFTEAIRQYWPGLDASRLMPDYAGIRPKISPPAGPAADFDIRRDPQPGLFHLLGIESPGLTSSLAIAEYLEQELAG